MNDLIILINEEIELLNADIKFWSKRNIEHKHFEAIHKKEVLEKVLKEYQNQ